MNIAHSTDRPSHEYQPTIIEFRPLISRLAVQLAYFREELKRSWPEFKKNPVACIRTKTRQLLHVFRSSPNAIPVTLAAVVAITCGIVMLITFDQNSPGTDRAMIEVHPEIVYLNGQVSTGNDSIGVNGPGRVGFQKQTGEGSGPSPRLAHGGGGGGNHNPLPEQQGKIPPPSNIQAAIPTAPPIHVQALPVAGTDIDPALWADLKAPVFGDPKSKSTAESKGPGEGEGIGSNKGLGVGAGRGPGYGPGEDGNIGGDKRDVGCCGPGGGRDGNLGGGRGLYRASEVDQKARLLSKPEPQYTEEARKNQLSGTVVLRAIFTSSGEVVQIRALNTLPFGLTERAIAAARQIRFVPALKGGQPVSVSMQLEYNFNLY